MATVVFNRTRTPQEHLLMGVFGSLTHSEMEMSEAQLRQRVEEILDTLPNKMQKSLLMTRYGFTGAPIPKIESAGEHLGLSRREARRLEDGAISWLHWLAGTNVKFARRKRSKK